MTDWQELSLSEYGFYGYFQKEQIDSVRLTLHFFTE